MLLIIDKKGIDIMDMIEMQKKIYENKVNKGFNVTDVTKEFCLLYGEVGEAYEAYTKKQGDFGEELADIAIYLMGIAEITGINLEEEIIHKVKKNEGRVYKKINGVNVKVSE